MKKKALVAICAAVLAFSCFALTACGGSNDSAGDDNVIKVGAVPTPHADILSKIVAPILEKDGYTLEVVEFDDYVLPNTALDSHEIDANYFQHVPYMEDFNDKNKTNIVSVATVHFEPFGIYAGKTASLDDLKASIKAGESVTISVPNDTTNEARALLLLQQEGIITLPKDADLTVTVADIQAINGIPEGVTIKELDAAQIAQSLQDVNVACINGNYAVQAGLDVDSSLAVEAADGIAATTYANVIACNDGDQDSDKIKALAKAVNDPEVRDYITKTYGNAVVPVF